MSTLESREESTGDVAVKVWAIRYRPAVVSALKDGHNEIMKGYRKSPQSVPESLSLHNRDLSEMRLCNFLYKIVPPQGYQKATRGMAWNTVLGETFRTAHLFYYRHDTDEVVCPTFGQFVELGSQVPGARIAWCNERLPGAISDLGNGVSILHGRVDDIKEHLLIAYDSGVITPIL